MGDCSSWVLAGVFPSFLVGVALMVVFVPPFPSRLLDVRALRKGLLRIDNVFVDLDYAGREIVSIK
jgi:hypothetical protein